MAMSSSLYAVLGLAGLFLSHAAHASNSDDIVDAPDIAHQRLDDQRPPSGPTQTLAAIDETDAAAALEGIRLALSEVADGGSYVWHRKDGRLSGLAQPTGSFKDPIGNPCRHLVVTLNTFARTAKIEGIACRTASGRWQLDG